MKQSIKIGFAVICAFITTSLFAQSDLARKPLNLSGFTSIQASGIASVYLTKGNQEKVELEMTEKYRDYVKVSVDNGVLNIKWENKERTRWRDEDDLKIKLYVTYKNLNSLTGSGATNFFTQNKLVTNELSLDLSGANNCTLDVDAGSMKVNASGACNVKLSGKTDKLMVDASGACNIKAYDLKADDVDADVSGVSNVHITAEKTLDVKASGISNVHYKGGAKVGTQEVSKMSHLKRTR
ncbi:MAG TPA: head GIN domain-containing protein [Sphingobacteriaceae bacterium]